MLVLCGQSTGGRNEPAAAAPIALSSFVITLFKHTRLKAMQLEDILMNAAETAMTRRVQDESKKKGLCSRRFGNRAAA